MALHEEIQPVVLVDIEVWDEKHPNIDVAPNANDPSTGVVHTLTEQLPIKWGDYVGKYEDSYKIEPDGSKTLVVGPKVVIDAETYRASYKRSTSTSGKALPKGAS